ncbi:MAG TPA: hypothetical protein VME17_18500 [Bryobacteraceae bacterium]|nr:hypothetical protein [Bryobacteraceae bacterium]
MFLTLLPFLTVAANLILVLGILCTLSQRVRQLRAGAAKQDAALKSEAARLSAELAELKTHLTAKLQEIEEPDQSLLPAAAASANGVNNTLRSKVLKMHRLGQSPERIAGSLRLPQGEVDLLVKVHRIVMRPYQDVQLAPSAESLEKV